MGVYSCWIEADGSNPIFPLSSSLPTYMGRSIERDTDPISNLITITFPLFFLCILQILAFIRPPYLPRPFGAFTEYILPSEIHLFYHRPST